MRLFTGIAIGPHVVDNLARVLKEMRPLAPLNWSPLENLHITSKFIGQWPEARLMELEEALQNLDSTRGFDVTVARFGYFPNPHRPHALFAGVQADSGLAELAKQIEDALQPLGVSREDRPYSPHLTLARIKHENIQELREHIANMTNFDFGTFHVSGFHLYLSNTGPRGPVYKPLATFSLSAAGNSQT